MEFAIKIEDEQLVGRLLSGLYTFIDGHVYYNNNVIKMRYDLLKGPNSNAITESTFFDFYYNIFPLGGNMRVRSNTPLDSQRSYRFAYIIQDQDLMLPKLIRILPYLHTRKLFLNTIPEKTNYYYTAVETSEKAE